MSEITNNENMRRYVHMALSRQASGGSSDSSAVPQMIVTGYLSNTNVFNPDNGQPSFSDAYQHFISGGTVTLKFNAERNSQTLEYHMRVFGYGISSEGTILFTFVPDGVIVWLYTDDTDPGR